MWGGLKSLHNGGGQHLVVQKPWFFPLFLIHAHTHTHTHTHTHDPWSILQASPCCVCERSWLQVCGTREGSMEEGREGTRENANNPSFSDPSGPIRVHEPSCGVPSAL